MEKKRVKTALRITETVLFAAVLVLILLRIQYVTRDKTTATMFDNFKNLEENSVSVFFVGNSHSFCSINTDLLYDEYGIDSFMMSASGQTIAMDYYAIEEAIKHQNPKTIYLEMSYAVFDWDVISDEMSHMFFDGMPNDSIKREALADLIDKEDRINFYIPLLQYHSRFDSLTQSDYASDLTSPRGSFYSENVIPCWPIEYEKPEEIMEMPENVVYYMDKIIALCRENDIELILYTVPYNTSYEGEGLDEMQMNLSIFYGIEEYAAANNLEYHNLFEEVDEIGLDYSEDFMDSQHFNRYGQEKFTRYMVEKGYIKD